MSLDSLCSTHTVTVERSPSSRDSSAGPKYDNFTPVTGLENLSASVQPTKSRERLEFAQRGVFISHRVYLAGDYTALVKKQDRVKDVVRNKYYRVTGIFDAAGRGELTVLEVMEQL